jgi:hypothetical protein
MHDVKLIKLRWWFKSDDFLFPTQLEDNTYKFVIKHYVVLF